MIFCKRTSNICWICYSTENLSGEHKLKKTDLNRNPVMYPNFIRLSTGVEKIVQGPNSKLLKFQNAICGKCNNQITQNADKNYDAFMGELANENESSPLSDQETNISLQHRTELARYFAKHLGCALDYQNFPIPRRLSRFVANKTSLACITLSTRTAPFCVQDETGETSPLNSLGGAILMLHNGAAKVPNAYHTAYSTDGIQFIVRMPLSFVEALEIRLLYLRNMGKLTDDFSNDEAMHRGLPYDNE